MKLLEKSQIFSSVPPPFKIPLKSAEGVIRMMHKCARPIRAGEVCLLLNIDLNRSHAIMEQLQDDGKVIRVIGDEETETWILTERPSARMAGEDP